MDYVTVFYLVQIEICTTYIVCPILPEHDSGECLYSHYFEIFIDGLIFDP